MKFYRKDYYVGIDGGATKTIACLGDKSGNIVEVVKVGASNYQTTGIEKTKKTLTQAMKLITECQEININQIRCICFGGAGVDSDEGREIITSIFREIGYKNELKVCNDGLIALVGANDGYLGGVVIGGTGSVALGVDNYGKLHKVGGWGHVLDDGGSGYAIARDALSKILRSYDGRGRDTLLWESIKKHLNISSQEEIIDFVYEEFTRKHDIANLAPLVTELYKKDEVATEIIDKAIDDLKTLVFALARNIDKDVFSLGVYGSVIVKNEKVRKQLVKRVHKVYPNINLHLPYKEAYIGALEIATGKVTID